MTNFMVKMGYFYSLVSAHLLNHFRDCWGRGWRSSVGNHWGWLCWDSVRGSNFVLAKRIYLWPWVETRQSDALPRLEHDIALSPSSIVNPSWPVNHLAKSGPQGYTWYTQSYAKEVGGIIIPLISNKDNVCILPRNPTLSVDACRASNL